MKIAYLASRPLGEKILRYLPSEQKRKGKNYIDISCLVTLSDGEIEPSGIDRWWQGSLIPLAEKNKIPIIEINKVLDLKPDIIFSVFYYDIIPKKILNCAPKGAINLHFGYLPNGKYHDPKTKETYRGRDILSQAIINDEKWQTVTFHYITEKIDLGPVIACACNKINKNTTVWDLQKNSEKKALQMLKKWFPKLIASRGKIKALPPAQGNYRYFSNSEIPQLKKIGQIVRAFDFPNRTPAFINQKIGRITKKIYLRK